MPDDETLVRQRLLRLRLRRPADDAESGEREAAGPRGPVQSRSSVEVVPAVPPEPVPRLPAEPVPPAHPPRPARPAAPPPSEDDSAAVRRLDGPGAFDPGRRGVRAIAAVAVLVVLIAAGWAWRSRPQAEPVPPEPIAPRAAAPDTSPAAGPSAAGEVVVAVAGRVRRPGLVRLPAGARVADALSAAGGVLPGTDTALVNLARRVADGELIVVGVTPPPAVLDLGAGAAAAGSSGPVNLNTATLAQLDGLPGVGPVLAQRILDYRERHGGFRSVGELRQVDGIGDARYEQLKGLVAV